MSEETKKTSEEQEAEKEIPVTDGDQEEENLTPEGEDLPEEENKTPGEEAAPEDPFFTEIIKFSYGTLQANGVPPPSAQIYLSSFRKRKF